jgi:putative membrane protein
MGINTGRPFMKLAFAGAASALVLIAGAALAAPADQPDHQSPKPGTGNETMSAMKDATYGLVDQISAEMTSTTKGFVRAAAISDMYEVTAGKIALQRASSPAVKEFAQKMVDAHTMTTGKLKGLMAAKDISVALPQHVDDLHQGLLDDLRAAKSADFDHRYISQQIAAHKAANTLFRGYAKDGDLGALKSFAFETDKDIRMHLDMAQSLNDSVQTASK